MNFLAYFRSLAAKFFHRSQIEVEMEEELRSHIQHRADISGGTSLYGKHSAGNGSDSEGVDGKV